MVVPIYCSPNARALGQALIPLIQNVFTPQLESKWKKILIVSYFDKDRTWKQLFPSITNRRSEIFIILTNGEPQKHQGYENICIDCKKIAGNGYYPFWLWSFVERRVDRLEQLFQRRERVANKKKFCVFMYRNPTDFRDLFFRSLSLRKRVESIGPHLNNMGNPTDRPLYTPTKTYLDSAVAKYQPYRFVIAMENSTRPGYITEKLINAFLAGAIPIYWGAPDVHQYFNPAAFVLVRNKADISIAIERILALENDEAARKTMLKQPIFKNEKLPEIIINQCQTFIARQLEKNS